MKKLSFWNFWDGEYDSVSIFRVGMTHNIYIPIINCTFKRKKYEMSRTDDLQDRFDLTHCRHHGHHSTFLKKTIFFIINKVATGGDFLYRKWKQPPDDSSFYLALWHTHTRHATEYRYGLTGTSIIDNDFKLILNFMWHHNIYTRLVSFLWWHESDNEF